MDDSQILITGANGQLGRALQKIYPNAKATDSGDLDITYTPALEKFAWDDIKVIINAAAYTNVDGAETSDGKPLAWAVNDKAVSNLAKIANENDLTLIHISTEYVFDGTKQGPYIENDSQNPLGEYAKSKAGGDEKAATASKHYIIRTSWVIGDGKNFARTILGLGEKGIEPKVVNDQIGRPTFTSEIARGIKYLLENDAPFGVYNLTNEGEPVSWADLTRAIFEAADYDLKVTNTTTEEYFADKPEAAKRPLNSVLDLGKIESRGFKPRDWREDLAKYIKEEKKR